MSTKNNPGNFDCYANAKPDEEIFTLLERDDCSPVTIRFWCEQRILRGKNKPDDAQITEALECARRMQNGLYSR